jgi:L-rhamnose mutarotase
MEKYSEFFKELNKYYNTQTNFVQAMKEGLLTISELTDKKGELCRLVKTEKCIDLSYEYHKKIRELERKYENAKDEKEKEKIFKEIEKLIYDNGIYLWAIFLDNLSSIHFSLICKTNKKLKEIITKEYTEKFVTEYLIFKKVGKYIMAINKPWWYEKKTIKD